MNTNVAIKLFGTDETPPAALVLRAGQLSAVFEAGNLRQLRQGAVECLRGVSYLVRDTQWGTYVPTLTDISVAEERSGSIVTYRARCHGPEGEFSYDARIEMRPPGTI